MIELSITVKDEKSKLVEKDTIYESFLLCPDNPLLLQRIAAVVAKFKQETSAEAPAIIVKAKLVVQS